MLSFQTQRVQLQFLVASSHWMLIQGAAVECSTLGTFVIVHSCLLAGVVPVCQPARLPNFMVAAMPDKQGLRDSN